MVVRRADSSVVLLANVTVVSMVVALAEKSVSKVVEMKVALMVASLVLHWVD